MIINTAFLARISRKPANANMKSLIVSLIKRPAGLDLAHRLSIFLGELAHESGFFNYDQEIWGPTPAQKRYEIRTNLGNTAAVDGDGFKMRGRGPIQVTGGDNYRAFTKWARSVDPAAPDFFANPDLILTDPWEGLSAIWFWETHNLNTPADAGSIETVTRVINGGTNGAAERITNSIQIGLALLGYADVASFQRATKPLSVDGQAGPMTRAALHAALKKLSPVTFAI